MAQELQGHNFFTPFDKGQLRFHTETVGLEILYYHRYFVSVSNSVL